MGSWASLLPPFLKSRKVRLFCSAREIILSLDINIIKNEIVPLFRQLAKDDQDSVRLLTVGACVEIAKILGDEDISNEVSCHLLTLSK